jgi:hypothetical protein
MSNNLSTTCVDHVTKRKRETKR